MVRLLQLFPALFPAFPFGQHPELRSIAKPKFVITVAFFLKGIDCAEAYDRLCSCKRCCTRRLPPGETFRSRCWLMYGIGWCVDVWAPLIRGSWRFRSLLSTPTIYSTQVPVTAEMQGVKGGAPLQTSSKLFFHDAREIVKLMLQSLQKCTLA
ncbi:hypothetical protein K440DRAFT_608834 [Wilcoxina mikolae CBS 423.85]|nr:hypothetical protein K440DRAFT_608834 [Wilcoxina mikolae CBS 423.85]